MSLVVKETVYEHLFPLTEVMRQRVVENFSGSVLDERCFEFIQCHVLSLEAITCRGVCPASQRKARLADERRSVLVGPSGEED